MGKIKSGAIQIGIAVGIIFAVMIIAAMTSEAGLGIAWIGGIIIGGIFFIKGIVNLIRGGIEKARNRKVSDEDYVVQDVETSDLDSFTGEDWRGRVFHGKYDNRYDDVRYPKEGKLNEISDLDRNRKNKTYDGSRYCKKCSAYFSLEYQFCPTCGKKFGSIISNKGALIKGGFSVLAIFLVIGAMLYGFSLLGDVSASLEFYEDAAALLLENSLDSITNSPSVPTNNPDTQPELSNNSNNNQNTPLTIPNTETNQPTIQQNTNAITYSYEPLPAIPNKQIVIDAIDQAFRNWETTNPETDFELSSGSNSDIEIKWEMYKGDSNEDGLAQTYIINDEQIFGKGEITAYLGSVDCREDYVQFDSGRVTNILIHEIGHIMGLKHHANENHLMYGPGITIQSKYDTRAYEIPKRLAEGYVGQLSLEEKLKIKTDPSYISQHNQKVNELNALVPQYNCYPDVI